MLTRTRLTAGRIRDLALPEGKTQAFLWDTEAVWLAVRVTSGAKAFVFQSRLLGKTLRLTIGRVDAWGIDEARAEARRLQILIDQGVDPRRERAERREETAREGTLIKDAWETYLAARKTAWGDRYYQDHVNFAKPGGARRKNGAGITVPGPLAPLLRFKLADLDRARVSAWLRGEAARRPTQARQAFGALRTFLLWCEDQPAYRGLADPEARSSRIGKQELPKKTARNDVLQREQLAAWFGAVRQLGNPVVSAYLQALLLTGARREELGTLTWQNTDLRWSTLSIRDKVDGERVIPLTPYVWQLINGLPRRNPWVFSSPVSQSGRLVDPLKSHRRALATAGLPHVSLHGLRRTFGTLTEWIEMPAGVTAQLMGHKPSAIAERHYRRRPVDLLRIWHERFETWVLEQAGIVEESSSQHTLRVVRDPA